jgi:ATP-binding cassette subfamily B protein
MTSDRTLLRRVLAEVRPYGGQISLVFLLGLLSTPLALLAPVPLKIAVDSVLGSDPLPRLLDPLVPAALKSTSFALLLLAAGLQVAVVVLVELRGMATAVLETVTGEKLTLRFRARLLGHVQRLSFGFHDSRGTADSIYRIQYDAPAIQEIAIRGIIPVLTAALTLVSMVYVMLRLDSELAIIALAIAPFLFWSADAFRRRTRPRYRRTKRIESRALGIVQEVLTSFRVVKAYGREEQESERFVDESREGVRMRIRLAFAERAFGMLVRVITAVGTAAVLFVGIRNVQAGALSLGELLMLLAYVGRLYEPLQTISKRSASLQQRLASAQRAFELLDEAPEVTERADARPIRRAEGAVRFEHVSFGYDANDLVLREISFDVPRGSRVGIAGRTGAGKTTLASLLSRFYDPTSGRILLDGVDLREYKLEDLRNQFAIMLQEPVLFSTTIAENIAYARPRAQAADIEEAARLAGAHDFVSELPNGYETLVGERGMRLSGGERQRISLARAFLKDAPILILDEPTSSVDLVTEGAIMEGLERLMKDRTTFMIAHRQSTLESCDRVLELRDGALVQRGP